MKYQIRVLFVVILTVLIGDGRSTENLTQKRKARNGIGGAQEW